MSTVTEIMLWYRCFLFFLLHLYSLTLADWDKSRLKDPQDTGLRQEKVFPVLLDSNGNHIDKWNLERTPKRFKFKAFNYLFLLELESNSEFLSPHFHMSTIEYSGKNTTSRTHYPKDNCYFKGHLAGEDNSIVSLSLCQGMLGFLHASHGDYIIEPIDPSSSERPHLITNVRTDLGKSTRSCDVDESLDFTKLNRTKQNKRFHRRRRSVSVERHLEVMVVADSKMANYHKSNLRHYILTLMSTVALIYKHPSIGNDINIAVVKLLIMNESQDREIIYPSAAKTLRNFCNWQQLYNDYDDSSPRHHDTAVLLTREDLCRLPKTCETLGLAQSGLVCDPSSSCAIVEDNGLSAAFTIAHELGHVLSIPHDDDHKCARFNDEGQRLHVMARMLDYNSHPWSWSMCSRHYITAYLDSGFGQCMLDKPTVNKLLSEEHANNQPGLSYDMDNQCELVFGKGSKICPYMPVCKRLWCTMEDVTQGGCRTQHMPWADGTVCGRDKWCQQGECVRMRSASQFPVDGHWGKWQSFGPCSRTCGGGVKRSERSCDNPAPARGGKYCVGKRVRYRSCHTQPCPYGSQEFREEQCAAFNGKTFNLPGLYSNVKWVPQHAGINLQESCKLYCRAVGTSAYFVLKDKVIDGTPCSPDTFDMCVNGKCLPAGCDHRLDSNKKLDMCGICGGDNSTCRVVAGHFNSVEYGYNHIVLIPAGASNLDIRQFGYQNSNDDNYLALRDSSGKYILNGDFMVSMFPKVLQYGGTLLEYTGSDSIIERINTTKQLKKDLIVMVLTVGNLHSPDVRFQYTVSLSDSQRYEWDLEKQWSSCSRACQGEQYRRPICVEIHNRRIVNEAHCQENQKPPRLAQVCNLQCSLRWKVVQKSECSSNCGKGIRKRLFKCMQQSDDGSQILEDSSCDHLGQKPEEDEECEGPCANTHWEFEEWSRCSQTCGDGIEIRSARCIDEHNETQPDSLCDIKLKLVSRPCNSSPCPHWEVGNWTKCSVTCGTGERQRPYWCRYIDQVVSSSFCDSTSVPSHKEQCQMAACAQWKFGNWGPCSVSCGWGNSKREVHCEYDGEVVDDEQCDLKSKPIFNKECNLLTCPSITTTTDIVPTGTTNNNYLPPLPLVQETTTEKYYSTTEIPERAEWIPGDWSECSVTCGRGTRKRHIVCQSSIKKKILPDSSCDISLQPPVLEICEIQPCNQWIIGEWSQCPVTCGEGVSVRSVICMKDNEKKEDQECDQTNRPANAKLCSISPCPILPVRAPEIPHISHNSVEGVYYWRTGHWGGCSKSCGKGQKRRQVACYDEGGHISNRCLAHQKPPTVSSCNSQPCPTWITSDWSLCSHSCGGGIQVRTVRCQTTDETDLSDEHCDLEKKPPTRQECNQHHCTNSVHYRWEVDKWDQCNVTCGTGYKFRHVYCQDSKHSIVSDKRCTAKKPRTLRRCKGIDCPYYVWKTEEWSECSETCGKGSQKRRITCHQLNPHGWMNPESIPPPKKNGDPWCDLNNRPSEIKSCNLGRCESNTFWKIGSWNECSHECGKGKQKRKVQCVNAHGKRLPQRRCDLSLKPKRRRNCSKRSCNPMNCSDLQKRNVRDDGEYKMQIRGRHVKIYCAGMNTSSPREYVTLISGEGDNYSEIYDKRLVDPETCPHNGTRQENCNCVNDDRAGAGLSTFFRIGINASSLQVMTHDFTFSQTHHGQQVPYGESGDCYSMRHCPQGRFSINLMGTGFVVSPKTRWVKQGNRPDSKIQKFENGQVVQGKCGGYCGKCGPDSNIGLLLDVAPP